MVAAAQIMTAPNSSIAKSLTKPEKWQEESWGFYDSNGELRAGVNWLSNGLSRVNLLAARAPQSPGDEPDPIVLPDPTDTNGDNTVTPIERRAYELVQVLAGGSIGQGQMLAAFGLNLAIAGLAWLVAEPDIEDPQSDEFDDWAVLSHDELRNKAASKPGVKQKQYERLVDEGEWRPLHPNALIVKVWRRHPHRQFRADAPTRAVMATLVEIDLLTKHIHASATSRLAGAGLLVLPSEVEFPSVQPITPDGAPEPDPNQPTPSPDDQFVQTFIQVMTVPIADRSSPAAMVPMVIKVPGEFVDKVRWITFSTGFDQRVSQLRDNAIKRLALGLEMPPEILTGVGPMNHWTAWQVEETAIRIHIAPPSEVVCEALTIGWLETALRAEGYAEDDIKSVMVWYDVTDLTTRPDRSKQATEAYDRVELSSEAYLRELGLSPDDAPGDDEKRERILLKAAYGAPTNAPMILAELGYLSAAQVPPPAPAEEPAPEATPDEGEAEGGNGPPAEQGEPPAGQEAAQAALVAACDQIVVRALERAGQRLRNAIGRQTAAGAAEVDGDPCTLHMEYDPTVYADLDWLLDGAWHRVDVVATRHGISTAALTATLAAYTRALLAAQQEHSYDRLAAALGARALHPTV